MSHQPDLTTENPSSTPCPDGQSSPVDGAPVEASAPPPGRRRDGHVPTFPEERLLVRPLADPVLDALGHDPRSAYVEQYWLSVLGPSAILLLRRLANGIEAKPEGFELEPGGWALELGLGAKGGKHGPFWRSVERICRFGAAQRNGEVLAVRRRLPPLTRRQIERLPEHLQQAHDRWSAERLQRPRRKTISQWSDRHNPEPPAETSAPPADAQVASKTTELIVSSGRDRRADE